MPTRPTRHARQPARAAARPVASPAPWVAAAVLAATLVQLLLGATSGLPQFAGKGFGARLVAYPALMLAVPAVLALRRRQGSPAGRGPLPWAACALVMAPFLVDVTGKTVDLYDAVSWWDDANHLVNWALLCGGLGLLLRGALPAAVPPWALVVLVSGTGALLAVGWELAEWYTFVRHSSELATAYEDTLGDEALGVLGATVSGLVLARRLPAAARR